MHVSEYSGKAAMVQNPKKLKSGLLVKKRSNQWENEVHEVHSTIPRIIPLSYGDRFIPRRYALVNVERNQKSILKKSTKDVLKSRFTVNYWRQSSFTLAIDNIFGIRERRVLEFVDPVAKGFGLAPTDLTEFMCGSLNGYDWPCRPRPKPLAFTDSTHDLPGFDSVFDPNLVDWSVNEQIVASFGQEVIIWKRKEDITMNFIMKSPRSLAYCPTGQFLAIGCKTCDYPVLELLDVNSSNEFVVANGKVFGRKHCEVQCIEWSKYGHEIVCGTQLGAIFVLSVPDLEVVYKLRKHKLAVTIIRFSPTMRYLASGDIEGNIFIYNWAQSPEVKCEVYLYVRSRRKLSVIFDWHPWNGVDLAISEDVPASIVILHVPSKEIVAYYQRKDTKIVINSVAFSKLTGELLVSVSRREGFECIDYKILVMSSLDRVVDMLKIQESGVRFMMWSPSGTHLATAGNDETLTIWNFYPGFKNKRATKQRHLPGPNFGTEFKLWSCLK